MQSVPITTNVVSSNPVHDEVYSIQHYVLKFVNDSRQVGGFLRVLPFPPPIKFNWNIVESGVKHNKQSILNSDLFCILSCFPPLFVH